MKLKTLFRVPDALRVRIYIFAGIALFLVAGLVVDHFRADLQIPYEGYRPMPYKAAVSSIVKNEPVVTETRKVQRIAPRPKSAKKVEKTFSLDLGKVDLLTVIDVPPSDNGSKVATVIDDNGAVSSIIRDNRPPLFALGGRWRFGGGIAWALRDGIGGTVLAEKRLGRVLGLNLEGRGSITLFQNGNTDARASLVLTK